MADGVKLAFSPRCSSAAWRLYFDRTDASSASAVKKCRCTYLAARLPAEAPVSLSRVPAVVSPALDEVDLFAGVLPDVSTDDAASTGAYTMRNDIQLSQNSIVYHVSLLQEKLLSREGFALTFVEQHNMYEDEENEGQ